MQTNMCTPLVRLWLISLVGTLSLSAADYKWDWSEYRKSVISPGSAGRQLVTAGIAQWRDAPEEWGQGMAGYGKRYADRVATHAIRGSIRYGVAYWRNEDIKFHPSGLDGKWDRIKYAMKRTFIVPRIEGPGTTVSVARFAGAYGAAGIQRAWHPDDRRTVGATLTAGSVSLGIDVAANLVKEFWPRKNKNNQTIGGKR
jgi:hypothetical protein